MTSFLLFSIKTASLERNHSKFKISLKLKGAPVYLDLDILIAATAAQYMQCPKVAAMDEIKNNINSLGNGSTKKN